MATQAVKDILNTEIPKPSFVLSPSVSAPLPSGVTVTRNGGDNVARTLDPYSGKFEHVPEDTPRVYGSDQSLLVEATGRTNHVKNSSDASGYFGLGGGSVSILDASDELLTGSNADSKRIESGGATNDRVRTAAGTVTSGTETALFLAEKGSSGKLQVQIVVLDQSAIIVDVDFANESETIAFDGGNHIDEVNGRYYNNGPNGNKRVALTIRYSGYTSGDNRKVDVGPKSGTSGEDVVFYHAQLEEAPNASSPIVTGSSANTRAGDEYTIFEGGQPSWWNPNEGTIFGAVLFPAYKQPDFTRYLELQGVAVLQTKQGRISFNHGDIGFTTLARSYTPFTKIKFAVTLEEYSMVFSTNGSSQSDTGVDPSGTSSMKFSDGVSRWQKLIYYPRALPESTLNTLTT